MSFAIGSVKCTCKDGIYRVQTRGLPERVKYRVGMEYLVGCWYGKANKCIKSHTNRESLIHDRHRQLNSNNLA